MRKQLAVALVTALSVGTIAARPAFAAPRLSPAHAEAALGLVNAGRTNPGASQQDAAAPATGAPHLFAAAVTDAARLLDAAVHPLQSGGSTPGQGSGPPPGGLPVIQGPMSPDGAPSPAVAASSVTVPGPVIQTGIATWYGPGFVGSVTYCGDVFDQWALTAASNTLPCGTRIEVTNQNTGGTVTVRINDRGGFGGAVILDLSQGAFDAVAGGSDGVIPVSVRLAP